MRLRKKIWARPELEASDFYIKQPEMFKGKWRDLFNNSNKQLHLELGCGKGGFISELAVRTPTVNFIAIDIKDEVLVLAKRKIEDSYNKNNKKIDNVKITAHEIMLIHKIFDKKDSIDRIYINFCNPWPKNRHKKRRLTHPYQLKQYDVFLKPGAQIWFKTDDNELFEDSIEYFKDMGYEELYCTWELKQGEVEDSIATEHEVMFREMGRTIKFLIVKKPD